MSDLYVRRLERIREEYQATSGSLAYVSMHWHRANIFNFVGLEAVGVENVQRAAEDIEATYIIRLFSAFEGILKEHLAQNHPQVRVPEDAKAVWLIDRVAKLQRPRIEDPLRSRVHDVRKYRNDLVHPGSVMPLFVQFPVALARLNRFVDKLPSPPHIE